MHSTVANSCQLQLITTATSANLAKGDVARLTMTPVTVHSLLIFFHHIRQMAARIVKLVLGVQ